jgi:hypothetical protein
VRRILTFVLRGTFDAAGQSIGQGCSVTSADSPSKVYFSTTGPMVEIRRYRRGEHEPVMCLHVPLPYRISATDFLIAAYNMEEEASYGGLIQCPLGTSATVGPLDQPLMMMMSVEQSVG